MKLVIIIYYNQILDMLHFRKFPITSKAIKSFKVLFVYIYVCVYIYNWFQVYESEIWSHIIYIWTDAEVEAPILWPPDMKSQLNGKDPVAGNDWRQKEKRVTEDEMVGMASLIQWTWTWANSGRWWGIGKPGMLQSMGLWRAGDDLMTERQHLIFLYIT